MGYRKKKSKQNRDPRITQKKRGDGDRTHEFWPKPCWLKLALPPSLRAWALLYCVGITSLRTQLVELAVQVARLEHDQKDVLSLDPSCQRSVREGSVGEDQ